MQARAVYKRKLQKQLTKWDAQIDVLAAKTRSATVDARAGYIRELEELRMMQRKATAKILELEHASDDTWQAVRLTADHLWHDLRIGIAGVVSRLR